jgi:hypothetical protein
MKRFADNGYDEGGDKKYLRMIADYTGFHQASYLGYGPVCKYSTTN